jgi:hypothetical protein
MKTMVGSTVHPWYKGTHEWQVEGISELSSPIEYTDSDQRDVKYAPAILSLRSSGSERALWFTYWISTRKTKGKLKWGGGSPMLEECVFLQLMKTAIGKGLFSEGFLKKLDRELGLALKGKP